MSTPEHRPSLTPPDLDRERRKAQAESLAQNARSGLEAMRQALESGGAPGLLEAVVQRDAALAALTGLHALVSAGAGQSPSCNTKQGTIRHIMLRLLDFQAAAKPLASPGHAAWTDLESLQGFRRAALRDLERLETEYAGRAASGWRSAADERRERAVRQACLRWGACLGLVAVVLAGWGGWQWLRQEQARIEMSRARCEAAAQGVKLISLAGWLAQKTQGKPLGDIAPDMSGACEGIDLRETPPNHPCREAWAVNRHALFRAAIPAPGKPLDAPSEVFFDPWGGPYVLLIPAPGPNSGTPRAVSAGPDGLIGTKDDVAADIPYWRSGQ